jgi:hypothetical protein
MKISIFSLSLALFFNVNSGFSQSFNTNIGLQDSLSKLSSWIWKQKSDSNRVKANEIFFKEFQSVLESKSSTIIPLDSIQGITRVTSDDSKLRIFTWNVPLGNGSNKYFGFIQLNFDSLKVIPLRSVENETDDFENKQLTAHEWYGAIYYKLIEVKIGEQKAYTLLGWDGYTPNSNRKLIDIISIDKTDKIVFGMPVFKTDKGIRSRVVKEYAEKANMVLRYDYQALMIKKGKKVKKENAWLIVMDRLVPMDPSMKGLQKYYVASGEIYDGYIFRNGYWTLVEDIDVINRDKLTK